MDSKASIDNILEIEGLVTALLTAVAGSPIEASSSLRFRIEQYMGLCVALDRVFAADAMAITNAAGLLYGEDRAALRGGEQFLKSMVVGRLKLLKEKAGAKRIKLSGDRGTCQGAMTAKASASARLRR